MINKPRIKKIKVNGILLLDKPLHASSNHALQKVKRLFNAEKAGHTGSLDPLATGMLPICFGEATKVCQFLLDSDKHYQVSIQLGIRTVTGDAEGAILSERCAKSITEEKLSLALKQFEGEISQIPPMYSAIKVQGKPLYELARKGIEIPRQSRKVQIHQLSLVQFDAQQMHFSLSVHCTKGTYIRTLADDLGEALGCGAYVSALHRVSVTPYFTQKMYTLSELEDISQAHGQQGLQNCLLPLETSVERFPAITLSSSSAFYLKTGQAVMAPKMLTHGLIRLYSESNQFLGMGEMLDDGRVTPKRLFNLNSSVTAENA